VSCKNGSYRWGSEKFVVEWSVADEERLCCYDVTVDMVKNKLQKLKTNKTPGVDCVGL